MAEAKMPDGTVVIIPDPNGMTCCNEVRGPYKPQPSRAEVWAMFAAAVLPKMIEGCFTTDWATAIADRMTTEYDKRWSNENAK